MAGSRAHGRGATIYAVAERAGVSIATVSRYLHNPAQVREANRQRVQRAIVELGYEPLGAAQTLAARSHEALGLIVPEITGQYYADLIAGFEAAAGERDLSVVLVLAAGRSDLARAARRLAVRVDGLAIMASTGLPRSGVDSLAARVATLVLAGDPATGIECVRAESAEPARELTTRLLSAGRRRLRFVGDPAGAIDVRDRHAGFVAAHAAYGLPAADPVLVPFDESGGRAAAELLLREIPLTEGLVCANDLLALALLERLAAAGIGVPEEIALTGWDDILAARYVRPRLTTVRQPVREIAALAAGLLHDRLTIDRPWGGDHVIPCEVIVRDSCGTSDPGTSHPAHH
ncbi:MAG: LacI family DNA-binding transcriptional regulator [Tetrasphaera sp.]